MTVLFTPRSYQTTNGYLAGRREPPSRNWLFREKYFSSMERKGKKKTKQELKRNERERERKKHINNSTKYTPLRSPKLLFSSSSSANDSHYFGWRAPLAFFVLCYCTVCPSCFLTRFLILSTEKQEQWENTQESGRKNKGAPSAARIFIPYSSYLPTVSYMPCAWILWWLRHFLPFYIYLCTYNSRIYSLFFSHFFFIHLPFFLFCVVVYNSDRKHAREYNL